MMAAVKTALFMAFEEAMNAPSGDQLEDAIEAVHQTNYRARSRRED
jgi:hypothetical protein